MQKVTGRTDDMMIIRGVNVFPTQIEELILKEPGLAPYFQCVLTQPGNMLELTVVVETHMHQSDEVKNSIAGRPTATRSRTASGRRRQSRCASRAVSSVRSARPAASSTNAPRLGRRNVPRCRHTA